MYRVGFLEPCEGCGGFVEVETASEYLVIDASHARVGDRVHCTRCGCGGVIDVMFGEQYCRWMDELCDICLASVVALILGMLQER